MHSMSSNVPPNTLQWIRILNAVLIEELLHEQSYTICTFSLSTIFHFIKHITHIAWASFLAIGICIVRFLKPIIIRHNLRNILSPRTLSFRICILGLHVARIS